MDEPDSEMYPRNHEDHIPDFTCDEVIYEVIPSLSPESEARDSNIPWRRLSADYTESLLQNENQYLENREPITNQPYINRYMCAIMVDWMMQVCSEFTLKRETFHLSVMHVYRYMEYESLIPRERFQLIGLGALMLASKTEEIHYPKLKDLASSSAGAYTEREIKQMELKLLRSLFWKTYPTTCCSWLSILMTEWDNYLLSNFEHVPANERGMVLFKEPDETAYRRFRESFEILDLSVLDPRHIEFKPSLIAATVLYLMVCKGFSEREFELILNERREFLSEEEEIECATIVHVMCEDFLVPLLHIESIESLRPVFYFLNGLMEYEGALEDPVACRRIDRERLEEHYEDYLAFETYSRSNIDFMKRRLR